MRRLLAVLVLVPAVAAGQGLTTRAPGVRGETRTNYLAYANHMSTAGGPTSPWAASSCAISTTSGGPGNGDWTVLTTNTAGASYGYSVTIPSAGTLIGSAYFSTASGTADVNILLLGISGVTACTCWRSDGGECTVITNATKCQVWANVGTSTVRLAALVTANATTSPQFYSMPGIWGTAGATARVGGAQLEISSKLKPSTLCVTAAVAKTCKD